MPIPQLTPHQTPDKWHKFIDDEDRKQRQERPDAPHKRKERFPIQLTGEKPQPPPELPAAPEPTLITSATTGNNANNRTPPIPPQTTDSSMPNDPKKKKRLTKKKVLKIALMTILVLFLFGVIGLVGVFAWYSRDLPDPDKILERDIALSTKIYDRSGEHLLYEIHGEERRTFIAIDQLPEYVKEATIAAEDQDFYKHHGFDLTGIVRALWVNILGGGQKIQGGSTITQQFIKNAILTREKTYTRKIKEVVLSYQMETRFSKDEILQLYLNEIPYGSNAYGIESAAQTYFGKAAKDLTLEEAALVASLPKAPTFYSPYGSHTDKLAERQKYVLNLMAANGFISQEEADLAAAEDILARVQPRREQIDAPHFVFYVRELLSEKYGEKLVEQGGLKVITTLDYDKQKIAEEEVTQGVEKYVKPRGGGNAALVSIDTKTGQVLAMVGSKDYWDADNDGQVNVALSERQPGSSFKPIVYLTAWERGYTPETIIFDLETDFVVEGGPNYHPRNYNLSQNGPLTMKKALAGSLNIPAVKTLYLAGVNNVLDTAAKLGYSTLQDRSRYGLSLVLGGGEVTLLEHTYAFSTLAREGAKHPLTPILKVEDKEGHVLEEFKDKEERVVDEMLVRRLNKVLSDNNERAYIFGRNNKLTLPDRPVAAKTGTTNDFRDAWTIGYTPSIATGVWTGNNDNTPMGKGADGSIIAAPIWNGYMRRALEGTPVEEFKSPEPEKNIKKPVLRGEFGEPQKVKVDKITGKKIPDGCTTYPPEFIEEKEIKEVHEILHYVIVEDPRGDYPKDPTKDPQYNNWEAPVRAWAEKNGHTSKDLEEENCHLRDESQKPVVTIISPSNGETANEATFTISISISSTRNIKKVEYFIDQTLVDTVKSPAWQTKYRPTNLTNGFHTLTVKGYDDVDNQDQAQADFSYSAVDDTTTLSFLSPSSGASVPANASQDISFRAYNAIGLKTITLYVFKSDEGGGNASIVQSFNSPIGDTFTATWASPLVTGDYSFYLEATDTNNQSTKSDTLKIKVTAESNNEQPNTNETPGRDDRPLLPRREE